MSDIRYFKVQCDKCGQHIEGDMEGFERLIQCPACSAYVMARPTEPQPTPPAPPEAPSPLSLPPPIQPGQVKPPEGEPKKTKFAGSGSRTVKPGMGLAGLRSPKMAVALIVAGFLIAAVALTAIHALLKPKDITISGQVFIVTKGAENIKLGAVEILLIEKQKTTDFLRERQAAIDSEIDIRQIALTTAKRDIETAKADAKIADQNSKAEMKRVPKSAEYVKIEAQLDALSGTNTTLLEKEKRLEGQLQALGVFYILTDPFGDRVVPGNPSNPDQFQINRLKSDGVDLAKARPLFKQLAAVLNALHEPGQIENAADKEKALLRQLDEIQQHAEESERQKLAAAQDAITSAESKAENLRWSIDQFPTAEDYLSGFRPVAIKKTISDADGKFSISYPRNKAFTLFASAQRAMINGTEKYCWLIDASTNSESTQIFLSNNNLAPVDPDHYFKLKPKPPEPKEQQTQTQQVTDPLLTAANKGDPEAQYKVGSNYWFQQKNYTEAAKWYRKAAEQSYPDGEYALAECYMDGAGVEKDFSEAVKWWRKAGDHGNMNAQKNLGIAYDRGEGVAQDHIEAAKWLRKAAEHGEAGAQSLLGICYSEGKGVLKDYAEAVKWFRAAADQGDTEAQNDLGISYAKGEGVRRDYAKAAEWFRAAADQGLPDAKDNLGRCYERGQGVAKDYVEAVKWYREAAEHGHALAQEDLAGCYVLGHGVVKDYVVADAWLSLSAAQGDEHARQSIPILEQSMTQQEIAEGQRLAREFQARNAAQ